MNHQLAVNRWNKKFSPGHPVRAEIARYHEGQTITEAMMIEGQAMIYVDGVCGPVPLARVTPKSVLGTAINSGSPE